MGGHYAEQARHKGVFGDAHAAELVGDAAQETLLAGVLGVVLYRWQPGLPRFRGFAFARG